MLNQLKRKFLDCNNRLRSVRKDTVLILNRFFFREKYDPATNLWSSEPVWTPKRLLFESKRKLKNLPYSLLGIAYILIVIYVWIFLLQFFYELAAFTIWDVASELSHKVGKFFGMPSWFSGLLQTVTVILGIVYLYRFLRSLGKQHNPRGLLPSNVAIVQEVEEVLSTWKGKTVSELIAAIGPPVSIGFTALKHPGDSGGLLGHKVYMWKDVPGELLERRRKEYGILSYPVSISTIAALTFWAENIGNRLIFYSWAWDGQHRKEEF